MKLLIDTNVILDILLKRDGFYEDAVKILLLSEKDKVEEYVSASAITDIFYIANRNLHDKEMAKNLIKKLLEIMEIAAVSENEIKLALKEEWNDFEDSVQFAVASTNKMNFIITRNTIDYTKSKIKVMSPKDFLSHQIMNIK